MRLFTGFRACALHDEAPSAGVASASHGSMQPDDHFPATVSDDWSYNDVFAPAVTTPVAPARHNGGTARSDTWVPYGPSSLVTLEEEIAALEKHTRDRQLHKRDLLEEQERLHLEINSVCQRVRELRELRHRVRDDETHEMAELDKVQARISSLEQTRTELQMLHGDALNNQQGMQTELEQLRSRHEAMRHEHNELEAAIARFVTLKETRRNESQQLAQEIRSQDKDLVLQRQQLLQITQEQQQLEERVRVRQAEVAALHAQRKQLRYQSYLLRSQGPEDASTPTSSAHTAPVQPALARPTHQPVDRLVARYTPPPRSGPPAQPGADSRLLWLSLAGLVLILICLVVLRAN
ncbi:MAG: hypothetical protein EPO06_03640 [Burkholderiaceae bacterium]|nr:MAG: hypothetical protein EPO06_03640 [Burkholderiaceae bacterium]